MFSGKLTPLVRLAALIAAAIHDLDHPGVSNTFLIKTKHPLAILYNDQSPLENHHLAAGTHCYFILLEEKKKLFTFSFCFIYFLAFRIIFEKDCNIFSHLSHEEQDQVRAVMIDLVLATDMARHFPFVANFNAKIITGKLSLDKPDDLVLALQMLVKCADISNPGKSYFHLFLPPFFFFFYVLFSFPLLFVS